jgi:hypothetical protein
MLSAALTLLVATEQVIAFDSTVEFLRRWFRLHQASCWI